MSPGKLDAAEIERLEQVIEEFDDRCRRGERPDPEAYAVRHPTLAAEIREALPALRKLHELTPKSAKSTAVDPLLPERIADYRIVRELGRGGMGVVYQAVQESLNRPVALKVLPRATSIQGAARERFRRESHLAAKLHHTNIVPIFGNGSSEGLDYYAMQYIEGESLDRILVRLRRIHADVGPPLALPATHDRTIPPGRDRGSDELAHRLLQGQLSGSRSAGATAGQPGESARTSVPLSTDIESANESRTSALVRGYGASVAKIGIQAASALAHAHAHGVLHRDIKPSNLLLDREGTVWVTDFGLAKHQEDADLTSRGDLVGTLRFMPPERFQGRADQRSDIYSLGLTLYELLTLSPPFEETDRQGVLHHILTSEPIPPRSHRADIPRDLENVVLKAIAKEPADRYATAAALAADLDRFLHGHPVSARPLGFFLRTWRWSLRNPVVSGLAASLLVVLAVGMAVVTWQWRRAESNLDLALSMQHRAEANLDEANRQRRRAEQNFRYARQTVDDYLTTISESTLLDVPTLEPVRMDLLTRAKDFYEGFVEDLQSDDRLKVELAASYIRLSQVTQDVGGDWILMLEKGLRLIEDLLARDVSFADTRSWRKGVYNNRAGWIDTDSLDRVAPLVERGIAAWQRLVRESPEIVGYRSDLAGLELIQGMIQLERKNHDEALRSFERSRDLRVGLVAQEEQVDKHRYGLGESHAMIAVVSLRQGLPQQALENAQQARDLLAPLAQKNPSATRLAGILAAVHQWIAAAHLELDNPLAALTAYNQALAIQERLSREYPYVADFQLHLAQSYRQLATSLQAAGREEAASDTLAKAVDMMQGRIRDYPDQDQLPVYLVVTRFDLAESLLKQQRAAEAVAVIRPALADNPALSKSNITRYVNAHWRLGRSLRNQQHPRDAALHLRRAADLSRDSQPDDSNRTAEILQELAVALYLAEDHTAAIDAARESLDRRVRRTESDDRAAAVTHYYLAVSQDKLELWDAAETSYRESIETFVALAADEDPNLLRVLDDFVAMLRRQHRYGDAAQVRADYRRHRHDRFGISYGGPWTIRIDAVAQPDQAGGPEQHDADGTARLAPRPADDPAGDPADTTSASVRIETEQPHGEDSQPDRPVTESSAAALDWVWSDLPPRAGLPMDQFRLIATAPLPPGRHQLVLSAPGDTEIMLDDTAVFQASLDASPHTIPIPSATQPRTLCVKYQPTSAKPRLRLWFTPVEETSEPSPLPAASR